MTAIIIDKNIIKEAFKNIKEFKLTKEQIHKLNQIKN